MTVYDIQYSETQSAMNGNLSPQLTSSQINQATLVIQSNLKLLDISEIYSFCSQVRDIMRFPLSHIYATSHVPPESTKNTKIDPQKEPFTLLDVHYDIPVILESGYRQSLGHGTNVLLFIVCTQTESCRRSLAQEMVTPLMRSPRPLRSGFLAD